MLSKEFTSLLLLFLLALMVGCRAYSASVEAPTVIPLTPAPAAVFPAQAASNQISKGTPPLLPEKIVEPTGRLMLPEAAALALLQNPALTAFSLEIRAQEAAVLQAGLLPNPQLSVQGSNLANSALKGVDGTSTTLQLSQLILLGGKIEKRVKVAQLNQDLAGWDYEARRLDVLTQVAQSFIAVLSAQEKLSLTQQLVGLAGQMASAVSKRVQAGKASPVEESKANVALSSVRLSLIRAKRELQAARKQLAATWGSAMPRFQRVAGQLSAIPPLPSLEQLTQLIRQNPALARWATEIAQRQALINLEQSHAIPDLTISLGGTQYANTDDYTLVAGISIPIPLFDRNQGGILAAQRRLTKAQQKRRATEIQVATALNSAYQRLAAAHAEIMALKTQILPAAQNAFEATQKGFRLGKFDFLSVLDAQRTLFDSKSQYVGALTDYHQTVAEVERLIGAPIEAARHKRKDNAR